MLRECVCAVRTGAIFEYFFFLPSAFNLFHIILMILPGVRRRVYRISFVGFFLYFVRILRPVLFLLLLWHLLPFPLPLTHINWFVTPCLYIRMSVVIAVVIRHYNNISTNISRRLHNP